MRKISTGDVVAAFRLIWPKIDSDMVRSAAEEGVLKATKPNPFTTKGAYDYDPDSLRQFIESQEDVSHTLKREVINRLGINFKQFYLFNPNTISA